MDNGRTPLWKKRRKLSASVEGFERSAKAVFAHPYVASSISAFALAACVWLWFWPPLPGVAVAVLGALAALVTFAEMQGTHKLLATVAIFVLMGIEIKDIRHDRRESDNQAANQRKLDRESFANIARGIDSSIRQSQTQFETTMDKVEPTLEASRKAVENTIPQAMMITQQILVGTKTPLPPTPNRALSFNVFFTNSGNGTAKLFRRDARPYLGKPDDIQQQREMWDSFDATWKAEEDFHAAPFDIDPNMTGDNFFSIVTKEFSETDVSNLNSKNLTIYIFSRFVYSDRTGKWVSDSCTYYQDITYDLVFHPCGFKKPRRYRATWQ